MMLVTMLLPDSRRMPSTVWNLLLLFEDVSLVVGPVRCSQCAKCLGHKPCASYSSQECEALVCLQRQRNPEVQCESTGLRLVLTPLMHLLRPVHIFSVAQACVHLLLNLDSTS